MSTRQDSIDRIADMLYRAQRSRECIDPIIVLDPSLDIDDAYAIQMKNIERELSLGAHISGKKIGLTSLAMQNMLGVNEPDYGQLLNTTDMTGKSIRRNRLIHPKVEGEIAFVLKDDLSGPDITEADVLAATDYVVGSIEIVDTRIRDWKIKLIDTVSDNASSALYVLGGIKLRPDEISLPEETMQLFKNGRADQFRAGYRCTGSPGYLCCLAG